MKKPTLRQAFLVRRTRAREFAWYPKMMENGKLVFFTFYINDYYATFNSINKSPTWKSLRKRSKFDSRY